MFIAETPELGNHSQEVSAMVNKLDVGKALDQMRGGNDLKSRMGRLDEKNKDLEQEIQRLREETLRLRRDMPARPFKRD